MGRDETWTPIETIEDDWYDGPIYRAVAERGAAGEVRVEVSIAAHLSESGWCSLSLGRADFQRYIDTIDKHAGVPVATLPTLSAEYEARLRANRSCHTDDLFGEIDALRAALRSLPVIRQCGSCAWCGPTSGGWSCDHPTSIAAVQAEQPGCPQGGHVDHDAMPPAWCPLREGGA